MQMLGFLMMVLGGICLINCAAAALVSGMWGGIDWLERIWVRSGFLGLCVGGVGFVLFRVA